MIYPAIRSTGDEGKRIADARTEEEDQSKKELTELEKLDLQLAGVRVQLQGVPS